MEKPIEAQLKEIILNLYGDMKSFAVTIDMPNSTLDSMFRRGLMNARISNVIQVAQALGISVDALADGKVAGVSAAETREPVSDESNLLQKFNRLDAQDKARIMERVDVMLESEKYRQEARPIS